MIPRDFIQTLLGRADIVDTIEHYIPLKKSGANYVARCPFHSEKTPSFSVNPAKQFYYCFGCGASGTALGFVMEYTGAGFVDAVQELARQVGLEVPYSEQGQPGSARTPVPPGLGAVLARAAGYYQEQLKQATSAIAYLKQRGLSGAIVAHYGVGYAPPGWHHLDTLLGAEFADALVESGLVIRNEEGKRYDRFRARIMFPILDSRGQIIGFGGRVMDQEEPKYLNSPETPLFEKGRELYGLTQARRAIRDQSRVLVVEGYMDVLALAQFGVEYAVATLGTATSATHVQKLLRMADLVLFAFDGDKAGQNAARRALEVCLPHLVDGKQIGFLFFPQGDDPDSFIRREGKDAFEALLQQAIPLSEYLLRLLTQAVDLSRAEGRAQMLQEARHMLAQITAPALSLLLRKQVAALAQLQQHELDTLLSTTPRFTPRAQRATAEGTSHSDAPGSPSQGELSANSSAPSGSQGDREGPGTTAGAESATQRQALRRRWGREAPSSLAARLLACLLCQPDLVHRVGVPREDLTLPDERAFLAVAEFLRHHEGAVTLALLLEQFRDQAEEPVIQEALRREFPALEQSPTDEVLSVYEDGLMRLEEVVRARRVEGLLQKARQGPLSEAEKDQLKAALAQRSKVI